MAQAYTQRTFSRNYYRAPIRFSTAASKQFHDGCMCNSSLGGMYFETHQAVKPGENVFIKMVDMVPDPYWPDACGAYLAEVRWCERKGAGENDDPFGVGVAFIMDTCSHCGKKIEHRGMPGGHLCPQCRSTYSTVSARARSDRMGSYSIGYYY